MSDITTDKPVIDRSRVSHRQARTWANAQVRLQRADVNNLTPEEYDTLMDTVDEMLSHVVVSVPDGWLPDGVKVGDDDWLGELSQDHWNELIEGLKPAKTGE